MGTFTHMTHMHLHSLDKTTRPPVLKLFGGHALAGISFCRYVTGPRMLVIFGIVRQRHGNGLQQQQPKETLIHVVHKAVSGLRTLREKRSL